MENFTLTLNNPSTQAEMLKIEQTQLKVTLYKDAVSDAGNGFGSMSMTRARKEILGESEEDIRNDLEQQRLEKAAAAEMEQTANVIKKTGMFDRVDKLYGDFSTITGGEPTEEGGDTGGDMGGDTGGDMGGFGSDLESAASSEAGAEAGAAESAVESTKDKKDNLLLEQEKRKYEEKVKKYQNIYLNRLMESLDKDEKVFDLDDVESDRENLNTKISDITKEIDNLIK